MNISFIDFIDCYSMKNKGTKKTKIEISVIKTFIYFLIILSHWKGLFLFPKDDRPATIPS